MSKPYLSILIPSYKRHGRIYRNLVYFKKLVNLHAFPGLLPHIEIIIADGSPKDHAEPASEYLEQALKECIYPLHISYNHFPDVHFFDRLSWLASNASSDIVTMLGDEDILVLDQIENLLSQLNSDPTIGSYGGRYIDIHGFSNNHLKLSLDEGWIDGYAFSSKSVKERLKLYRNFRGFGLSPLMYSLLRRDNLIFMAQILAKNKSTFTYIAGESIINHLQLSSGSYFSTRAPFILRDRTYIGRAIDETDWSNIERELESERILKDLLVSNLNIFSSEAEADAFFEEASSCLRNDPENALSPLVEYRKMIDWSQPHHSAYLRSQLHPDTYLACFHAWKDSVRIAYPEVDLRVLGLRVSSVKRAGGFLKYMYGKFASLLRNI